MAINSTRILVSIYLFFPVILWLILALKVDPALKVFNIISLSVLYYNKYIEIKKVIEANMEKEVKRENLEVIFS